MHVRFPRAAVAQEPATPARSPSAGAAAREVGSADGVLWASRPLPVASGHLVALRLRAGVFEVALVPTGGTGLRWVDANRILVEDQLNRWRRLARFSK